MGGRPNFCKEASPKNTTHKEKTCPQHREKAPHNKKKMAQMEKEIVLIFQWGGGRASTLAPTPTLQATMKYMYYRMRPININYSPFNKNYQKIKS